jgi:hypothetical protein
MIINYENWSTEVFHGLYESMIYNSDTFYIIAYNEKLPEGYYLDFRPNGWEEFKKEVLNAWYESLRNAMYSIDLIGLDFIKPLSIWSPTYYNYYTDKINIQVKFDLRKLKKYCFTIKKKEFSEYLYNNWSNRDGFLSFVPNNITGFKEKLKSDKCLIDVLFEFFLLQEVDLEQVNMNTAEETYSWLCCNLCLVKEEDGSLWDY